MSGTLPAGWTVRDAREGDLDALHALRLRAITDHPDAFGATPEGHPDPAAYRRRWRERKDAGMVMVAVFDAEDRPVAMGRLMPRDGLKEAHKGDIFGMYTAGEVQGRGVGAAVLAALIARARELGLERLVLAVTGHNPARRVYERAGFVAWGTEPDALKVGGTYYHEVWMGLDLRAGPGRG